MYGDAGAIVKLTQPCAAAKTARFEPAGVAYDRAPPDFNRISLRKGGRLFAGRRRGAVVLRFRNDRILSPTEADAAMVFSVTGAFFGEVRPAATIVVCGLLKAEMKVEVEVTAYKP